MPVILKTAQHSSRQCKECKATKPEQFLREADAPRNKGILKTSFTPATLKEGDIFPSNNGLVSAAKMAYSSHHNLILRPEDIWFAILTQLSFYINAHAEQLRSFFVTHQGQKELLIYEDGCFGGADIGALATQMTSLIEKNLADPDMREFIIPSFSTTTSTDVAVASVLMMGAFKKYFTYGFVFCCGIPSVQLLGEREDWASMLKKIDKIAELGPEPTEFVSLLRPVLRKFVASFDNPTSPEVLDFWSKIARESADSGDNWITGWISAFNFWDEDGQPLNRTQSNPQWHGLSAYELDGFTYHLVNSDKIPSGCGAVPVKINDNGNIFYTMMVAGSFGVEQKSGQNTFSIPITDQGNSSLPSGSNSESLDMLSIHDTLQPWTGWIMYRIDESEYQSATKVDPPKPPIPVEASKDGIEVEVENTENSSEDGGDLRRTWTPLSEGEMERVDISEERRQELLSNMGWSF